MYARLIKFSSQTWANNFRKLHWHNHNCPSFLAYYQMYGSPFSTWRNIILYVLCFHKDDILNLYTWTLIYSYFFPSGFDLGLYVYSSLYFQLSKPLGLMVSLVSFVVVKLIYDIVASLRLEHHSSHIPWSQCHSKLLR